MYKITLAFILLIASITSSKAFSSCAISIDSNDAMQFSKQTLSVPSSCKKVTLTLNHTGKLPKKIMGHNWVLTTSADVQAVAMDGMRAGAKNNYLKPNDTRVLAASELIGGGGSTTLEFSTEQLKAKGDYTFFCSFPGHFGIMKGQFKFV